ncbi:MAG: hypothetical protein E2O56_01540 [Gammaproteobacteria bacterium]|nr:MAG: hypothetical protein E2O56_01540 [Gammaproteobacteria bacterium]
MRRGNLVLAAVAALLAPLVAGADSQLTYVRTKAGGQEYVQPPMEISNGKIRFASDLPSGQWMLFDERKKVLIVVDEKEGTWTPLTPEGFAQISALQQQAMESIQARLAQLPEDQREQAMKMMPQMPGMTRKEAIRTQRTTRTMDVGKNTCVVLEIYRGSQKTSESCVVPRQQLGIPKEDYNTLMAMQDFFVDISSSFFEMDTNYFFGDASREEIPVYMVDFDDSGQETTRFQSASFESIDPGRFKLDPRLREKDIMSQMQR